MPRLTLNTSDFVAAIRPMLKASKRSAASELTFSFVRGDLVIVCAGVEVSAPASGDWQGTASTHKSVLRLLAKLKGGTMDITFTNDGRLHVGPMSFDARWLEGPKPEVDLPLEPTLLQVLRLRLSHSDESLLAAGLLERVLQAERQRERHIELAAFQLKELGDFRSAIHALVRNALELPSDDSAKDRHPITKHRYREPTEPSFPGTYDPSPPYDPREGTTDDPPPPYGPTRPQISREEARAIAEQHLAPPATGIGEVLAFDELKGRRVNFYNTSGESLQDCWIAYVQRPVRGLFSSTIIVISRRTGRVVHIGSAGDEG